MRIICRGCLIGFDGRSRQQYCSTGCANRARVKSGVVLNRIPKMSKEKWADLCKRFTTKEIIANERLTGRMCVV